MFANSYNTRHKAVKKKLIDLNLTQAELARLLGVGRSSLNLVIQGKRRSRKIEQALSALLENDFKKNMFAKVTNPEKKGGFVTLFADFVNLTQWSRHWGFDPHVVRVTLSRHAVSVSNPQPKPPRRFTLAMQICRCMAETIGWPEAAKYFPYLEPFDEQARGWMEQIRLERVRKLQEKQQDAGGKSAV